MSCQTQKILMRKSHQSSAQTGLNSVSVGPLTIARAMLTTLVMRTQQNFQIARKIAAMVESVERLEDRFNVVMSPEVVPQCPAMLYMAVGKENVAMKSVMSVEKTDQSVLINLKFDAYVLERASMSRSGPLVSRMATHLNSKFRINLRETVEAEIAGAPVVGHLRLSDLAAVPCSS